MDAAQVIRAARRHAGWSQRELARSAGVATRSVAAWEAGGRSPSSDALDRVLAAVGLDVVLVPRAADEVDAVLRRHLMLSLTQRLRLALGESPKLPVHARSELWRELGALARRGQVVLDGQLAVAMWLPLGPVERPGVNVFHPRTGITAERIGARIRDGNAPAAAISFMMEVGERVWVLPPGELAFPSAQEVRLRQADLLLNAQAPIDDAARRRPAHRDPDEAGEDWRLLRTKGVKNRPDMRDGRGWRLGASASLAQRLRLEGQAG